MYIKFFKPVIDFLLALIVIILLSPVLIITAVCIKLDSKGPVLFKQTRLGKNEKEFMLYKFRSMTDKDRSKSEHQVFEGDPEITKVGQFIRRTKIDELPQLLNILKGEMAIIGPRACLPKVKSYFGQYSEIRFKVKPGLSSLAALHGSIFLSWEEKGYWDKYYVEHISFITDIKVIAGTVKVMLIGEEKLFNKKNSNGNKTI